ncbi:MAG: hypothetical protein ACR2M9_01550 [Cyanophyceae cyanobacterium]
MGTIYDTTHAEENKHCLICHQENAVVIHHALGDVKAGDFGHIQVICHNKECQAEFMIPRLTDPRNPTPKKKNTKKKNVNKTESWF